MGRPSKKHERTEQILNAFQCCVARYGLEGSTLERISEQAGLRRSLVRHFVGNRDELVLLLANRVIRDSEQQWGSFMEQLPEDGDISWLLEGLFGSYGYDTELMMVINALMFASGRDPGLQRLMQDWMRRFSEDVSGSLRYFFPQAAPANIQAVSFGLISLYLNLDAMGPLGMQEYYGDSGYLAASALVETLAAGKAVKGAGEINDIKALS